MGKFSTTVQIKDNIGRMKFINSFCDVMKKRGFVACSEDEAALSYLLAFSNGGWVTLASENYVDNPKKAEEDAQKISAEMKTSGFSVEVVDSDFAVLTLNGNDRVIVGDGSGYGIEDAPKGDKKLWEPLLAASRTWEQLSEIWNKDEVFVEDALYGSAPMFGIESEYMTTDYEELSGKAGSDKNIASLYFKKAADSQSKPMTLNAAFIKVFGEALEPLGFKKIKSRYPYFVRVVNNEILHIISVTRAKHSRKIGGKTFDILCGIATVYRGKIDFNVKPENSWLKTISYIYMRTHTYDLDIGYKASIRGFNYDSPISHINNGETFFSIDESELKISMNKALDATKQTILPVFDEVTSLMACEKYFNTVMQTAYPSLDFEGEGLFLMKLFSTAEELYQFMESEAIREMKDREFICNQAGSDFTLELKRFDEEKPKRKKYWFDIFNDLDLQAQALAEYERRKKINIEILIGLGLNF